MIASSSTVLANLAYLIGAIVVAVIAGVIIWLRHRQPRSVDANMASFRRGLSALAPDGSSAPATIRRSESAAVRAPMSELTHVRIEPSASRHDAGPVRTGAAAEEATADGAGGQAG